MRGHTTSGHTHTKSANETNGARQRGARKAQRHSNMSDSSETMESTENMAAQAVAHAAASTGQRDSMDGARGSKQIMRTHTKDNAYTRGNGGDTAPASAQQHAKDKQAGQQAQRSAAPTVHAQASPQVMTEPATTEQERERTHTAGAQADEETRRTEVMGGDESGRHTAQASQAGSQWTENTVAHSSTQGQGESEEVMAERETEQTPVVTKAAEGTGHVEDTYGTTKREEPTPVTQEQVRADRPHQSTQPAAQKSVQSKEERRSMHAPATPGVEDGMNEKERQVGSRAKNEEAAVGNLEQQAKRPRSDTATADDKHDDERQERGLKRVATNASGHGGAARSGHAPADGGNAAGWSGEPSTCDDGVDASLQSSGIGGSDERIHGIVYELADAGALRRLVRWWELKPLKLSDM